MKQEIVITCNQRTGWMATFRNVPDMPNETIPLPFTSWALATTVVSDMVHRFPKTIVRVGE